MQAWPLVAAVVALLVSVLWLGAEQRAVLAGAEQRAVLAEQRAEQRAVLAEQRAEQRAVLAEQRAEQEKQRAEQEKQRAEQEKQRAEQEKQRAEDPDHGKQVAMRAFQEAERWRTSEALRVYHEITDEEFDSAARFKGYAQPFASNRSCKGLLASEAVDALHSELQHVEGIRMLSNFSRQKFLAELSYHSTGLEGNTLSLPETTLVIAGQELFAGFPDHHATPSFGPSITEAGNLGQLYSSLKLAELPGSIPRSDLPVNLDQIHVDLPTLESMQSAIVRGSKTPTGLRRLPVAVGHTRVLLPMPDELPALIADYVEWLRSELAATATGPDRTAEPRQMIDTALSLACDAHTRFVHIHPFADGNGRLARLLSSLVLQHFGLPPAMISRNERQAYMAAVTQATAPAPNYSQKALCDMHAEAVARSLSHLVAASRADSLP